MSMEITTIVEEELLPDIDVLVGVDADPVVAGHHQDLHLAVGLAAVVRKSYLSTHPEVDGQQFEKIITTFMVAKVAFLC